MLKFNFKWEVTFDKPVISLFKKYKDDEKITDTNEIVDKIYKDFCSQSVEVKNNSTRIDKNDHSYTKNTLSCFNENKVVYYNIQINNKKKLHGNININEKKIIESEENLECNNGSYRLYKYNENCENDLKYEIKNIIDDFNNNYDDPKQEELDDQLFQEEKNENIDENAIKEKIKKYYETEKNKTKILNKFLKDYNNKQLSEIEKLINKFLKLQNQNQNKNSQIDWFF